MAVVAAAVAMVAVVLAKVGAEVVSVVWVEQTGGGEACRRRRRI